jgi:hypothetical protein
MDGEWKEMEKSWKEMTRNEGKWKGISRKCERHGRK